MQYNIIQSHLVGHFFCLNSISMSYLKTSQPITWGHDIMAFFILRLIWHACLQRKKWNTKSHATKCSRHPIPTPIGGKRCMSNIGHAYEINVSKFVKMSCLHWTRAQQIQTIASDPCDMVSVSWYRTHVALLQVVSMAPCVPTSSFPHFDK